MKPEELYNLPNTIPTPTNEAEAFLIGSHLMQPNVVHGKHCARIPEAWLNLQQAGQMFANGFKVERGWFVAYEPGWLITW